MRNGLRVKWHIELVTITTGYIYVFIFQTVKKAEIRKRREFYELYETLRSCLFIKKPIKRTVAGKDTWTLLETISEYTMYIKVGKYLLRIQCIGATIIRAINYTLY